MTKVLHGDANGNQLNASENKTQVYGLKGNDTLISDGKSDVLLIGGSGNDSLIMLGGNGSLSGGDGSDVFELNYSADKKLSAVIEDLDPSEDKILVKFDGDTEPQISVQSISGGDVVLNDNDGNFNVTLKSVRDNDYFDGTASLEAWKVLELTNAEREKANLSPLTMSQGLTQGASIRAKEITDKGKEGLLEDHTRLDNKTSWLTVFDEIGKSYANVGENLDGGARTPEIVVNDWITSEKGHREILLGADYKKIGIGYNEDDPDPTNHRFYWTQWFAESLTSDGAGNPETVTAASLLVANVESSNVTKFIVGDDNANNIENSDYGASIEALGGNDTITNAGLNVSISGGADNDLINNNGSFSTINAGAGNDSINLSADTKEILIEYAQGDGSDTISGFNATDTLSISKDIVYTPELVVNDIILTIDNDSITLLDTESLANDMTFIDGYWSGVIVISDDNYNHNFSNGLDGIAGATIQALGGNNTITNGYLGNYVSIDTGNGNDSIFNNGQLSTITSNGGNDSIQNIGGNGSSIKTGNGNNVVSNLAAEQVTIETGAGNDTVENGYRSSKVSVNTGSGNDSISNSGANISINAGVGNDSISNWSYGTGSSIQADKGNDYINNNAETVTIDSGIGNDYISNSGSNVTIGSGADNDTISNSGNSVSIDGGNDNDTINSSGSNVTITGGRGNDRIELSEGAQNNLIEYNDGDGLDEVWGFNETDTLRIGDGTGTYYPETLNGHLFIHVGKGYFAFGNGASLSTADIVEGVVEEPIENDAASVLFFTPDWNNTIDNITLQAVDTYNPDHSIVNSGSSVTIIPGESYNTIDNSGDDVYIFGQSEGSNTISNTGDNVTIEGNNGYDSITNEGNNVKINNFLQYGLDTLNNSGNNVLILGGDDKDTITNSGNNVYILGDRGNDIIELSDDAQNNIIAYSQGDGHDIVKGFNETDTLLVNVFSSGSYSKQTVDNDIIIDVNNGYGSVTLEDAATLKSAKIIVNKLNGEEIVYHVGDNSVTFEGAGIVEGNRIILGEGDDSYHNTASNMFIQAFAGDDTILNDADNVTIDLGADKDYVISQGNNVSISGVDGDDTIYTGSESNFNATIDGGDGNDELRNFISNGSVSGGAGDDTIENFGNVVTIRGGEGNDSIKNSDVTIREQGDNSLIDLGEGNNILWNYGNNVTILSGSGDNLINNYGDSVKITTGAGDDTIYNSGDNISIKTGVGNDSVFSSASNTSIDLGTDNDFLHNRGDNVSILMNDGDDTVITDASNVTINAGAGNDRITLESGVKNNLILYTPGDGDDTIWGLDENSRLQIGDGHSSYSTVGTPSGDDIIVKVGDNTITLKNFREKPENIIIGESGSSGGNSGNGGNSGGGNSSSGGNGGSGGNSGGSSTGGTSASEGRGSDASGGQSATGSSGTSASSGGNDSGSSINTSNLNLSGNVRVNHSAETPAATFPTTTVTTPTTNSSGQYVYTGGNQIISDYQSWQKIIFSDYTESLFDGAGNFLIGSSNGALAIENAVDKIIDVSDASGNAIVKAYLSGEAGMIDGRGLEGYEIIHGSLGEDLIYAGDYGSQLWGNADNAVDSLVGGAGSDFFVGGMNQGADLFFNVSSADAINLNDATLENIVATYENEDKIAIAFDNGNIIGVQSSEALSGAFVLADGSIYRYNHINRTWQNE